MPTGAELDARAAALNGDGTAGLTPGEIAQAMDGFPVQGPRVTEDMVMEAVEESVHLGHSLAAAIFAEKEPRRATTIRGVPVEYTTLTIPQVRYINDHCYRKVGKQLEPIYSELFPTVCIFALRVPGTDTPVFTMRQKADVLKLSETLSIANDVLALCGLTKPQKDAIVGNSEAADTAA